MELTHRCLAPYDAWYVELKFVNAFFQIYEDNIRQNLKSIPSSINYDLWPVPKLAWMAHPWLRQFMLVNLRLKPMLLFSIENEDIINNSFFAIAFSASEYKQELAELSRWMAIAGGWWRTFDLLYVKGLINWVDSYLDHIPPELDHLKSLIRRLSFLALNRRLSRNEGLH